MLVEPNWKTIARSKFRDASLPYTEPYKRAGGEDQGVLVGFDFNVNLDRM